MSRRPNPDPPRMHWVLLSVLMVMLLVAMLISGVASGQVGEGARSPASRAAGGWVPETIRGGGPVIDANHPQQAGLSVPDRHVVLTFDDGPTAYTAEILDVLAEEGVPATFFVVGAQAADRPDLLRRMYAEGHEVGVHTFTHANLANVTALRQRIELDQTQLAIAAATGRMTGLLRPPYSSEISALLPADWRAAHPGRGLLGRLHRPGHPGLGAARGGGDRPGRTAPRQPRSDRHDARRWRGPGADRRGAAGDDRRAAGAGLHLRHGELGGRTVLALARRLAGPTPAGTADQRSRPPLRRCGWCCSRSPSSCSRPWPWPVPCCSSWWPAATSGNASRPVRASPDHGRRCRSSFPAYNEELGIAATVQSLAACDYPELEIVVVDDGSTDATAAVVAGLSIPGVRLLRQANAGKPAALNAGIRAARHDVLVLVDGDTVFEPDTMKALVRPLAEARRSLVGAVSGNTKVGNRRGLLGRWQHIEYVIGFNLDRRMFDVLQCMPTIPGAIGAFRRQALAAVGGVSEDTLAEDTDLTMAICRAGWRVRVRARGPRLDRGAGHPGPALAAAVPLVLRDHAGDVEAPRGAPAVRRRRDAGTPRAALPVRLPGVAPPAGPGHRHRHGVRDLSSPGPRSWSSSGWRSWPCSCWPPVTPSGWTASGSDRCGACPCNSSSTGS